MIDWAETKKRFNRSDLSGDRPKVVVVCDKCGFIRIKAIRKKSLAINNQIPWECNTCVANRPEKKEKSKSGAIKGWKNEEYRQIISTNSKRIWEDEDRASKMASVRTDPQKLKLMTEKNRIKWLDPLHREKMAAFWKDPNHCQRAATARANHPKVSSLQTILYSILDDLGVKYYREREDEPSDPQCIIGPYNFDCVIPREGKPSLLIECQGEYWHKLEDNIRNDKAKSSYIENNLSAQYELKILWEHEFSNKGKILENIKYWLGVSEIELIDFEFDGIIIKDCPASEYRLLLSKYHYLSKSERGGMAYGAYLGEELIAVCVFSPLVRQNIRTGKHKAIECRELSRLCIHPRYQKRNFASWLISRCIKSLDSKYKLIISYCDTTFNHDGATYKACNFKEDGKVPADYWYVDENGWVMHKKALYSRAVKFSMKEKDYAEKNGYRKVFGKEKLRFIYER